MRILMERDNSKWSGATFKCDGKPFIIYNNGHAEVRQESTLMHEISHIICGHEPTIPIEIGNLNLFMRDHNPEHEAEAEWLGACLQLPREGLLWALKRGWSANEIANNYGASLSMTNYRIGITGVKYQIERSRKYYRY